jgi:GGDEF-like domain/PucR C-terminal helix-turn-helix domain
MTDEVTNQSQYESEGFIASRSPPWGIAPSHADAPRRSGVDPPMRRLSPACTAIARGLRSRSAELESRLYFHVRSVEPGRTLDDVSLQAGLLEMITACIEWGLAIIERAEPWSGPIPPAVAEHARRTAAGGWSLQARLRCLLAARTLVSGFVIEEVARIDLPEEQRLFLLAHVAALVDSLLERLVVEVADVHISEIRRSARSREQRQAEIAHRLLAGPVDTAELAELAYDLDAWHTAVIATGAEANRAVGRLAAELGCGTLVVPHGPQASWGWLGAHHKLAPAAIERVFDAWIQKLDASFAIGEPARGLEGWRLSHHEARAALEVARWEPRRLTLYRDVEPEASALQDQALGDSLIERFLTPLDGTRIGGEEARKTLRALLEAGGNVSAAARALPAHRVTIYRRRETIEECLGFRLYDHRAEIERALRLEELRRRRDCRGSLDQAAGDVSWGRAMPNLTRQNGLE